MPIRLYEDGTAIKYARSPGGNIRGGRAYGLKKKHFTLTGKHKRLIRSSAIRQALTAKYNLLFCTLTFPKDISQRDANRCFSNFADNLKTNFNLNSYVTVKENTKRGRPHFHCIFDIPFTDFKILNKAWCSAFSGFMPFAPNAFTTGRRPIIKDIDSVIGYITKYITKADKARAEVKPETRLYFISQNVHSSPVLISEETLDYFIITRTVERFDGDYFTWFRVHGFADLPEKWEHFTLDAPKKKKQKPRKIPEPLPELALQFEKNNGYYLDYTYKL